MVVSKGGEDLASAAVSARAVASTGAEFPPAEKYNSHNRSGNNRGSNNRRSDRHNSRGNQRR